jgi:HEAT repeat protein
MKKRLRIAIGLLLVTFAVAILAVPENRLIIGGYLRGEHLFEGRPTSYWRYKVEQYASRTVNPTPRANGIWRKFFRFISPYDGNNKPDVLSGNSKAMAVLIDLLMENENHRVMRETCIAIENLGVNANDAIPILKELLASKDSSIRSLALQALGRIGPSHIQHLTEALKNDDFTIRRQAAGMLGQSGFDARKAIPALVEALKDEDEGVRIWAAIALKHIDPEEAKKAGADNFIPPPPPGAVSSQ